MVNPTGYTALDLIGFTDKGPYSSSDNYVKNDLVHYSGNIWRCLIDDTTGIAPAEGVNWTLFIGEPTNLVERIIAPVETDPATNSWAVGRQIIYNDNLYEVITAITAGDALVAYEDDPTNANIKLADPVETQIQTLANEKMSMKELRTLDDLPSSKNLFDLDDGIYTIGYSLLNNSEVVNTIPTSSHASGILIVKGYLTNATKYYTYIPGSSNQAAIWLATASNGSGSWTSYNQTNPNLLGNGWFTVNQRGQSSYSASGYTFDRWKADSNLTVSKVDDIVTVSAQVSWVQLYQILDSELANSMWGKIASLSYIDENNTVHSLYITMGTKPSADKTFAYLYPFDGARVYLSLMYNAASDQLKVSISFLNNVSSADVFKFKAIKLEMGGISTLALDTPPNYEEELLKCQRYFARLGSTSCIYLGTALALDNDKATGVIKLPTTMRTVPTVTGITNLELSKGSSIAITALDSRDYNNGYLALTVSASGTTVGSCYLLRVKADTNIDFSADL